MNRELRVTRDCGFIEKEDRFEARMGDCVRRSGTHQVILNYCTCEGDRCNAAPGGQPTLGWLLSLGVASVHLLHSLGRPKP